MSVIQSPAVSEEEPKKKITVNENVEIERANPINERIYEELNKDINLQKKIDEEKINKKLKEEYEEEKKKKKYLIKISNLGEQILLLKVFLRRKKNMKI
jgi:hypothetical protein